MSVLKTAFGLADWFLVILFLYGINIVLSAALVKKYRGYKYLTLPLTILASLGGVWFALVKLIHSERILQINLFKGIYPFEFKLQIHNLAAFFILVISLSYLFITVYSIEYMKHYETKRQFKLFALCINLFVLSMLLVVTAGQFFFFLIAWEIMVLAFILQSFLNLKKPVFKKRAFFILL